MIVDIVSSRQANLHDELLVRLAASPSMSEPAELYATAYHPLAGDEQPALEYWCAGLAFGQPLPVMPLWLRGEHCTPVLLNSTYRKTCGDLRIIAKAHD